MLWTKKNKVIFVQINKSFSYRETVNQYKTLITVFFTSSSQSILNFPLSSYNTDAFSIIEEKLYLEKPELKHKHAYFLSNGKIIDNSLTLEQNKIKDNDAILIQEND